MTDTEVFKKQENMPLESYIFTYTTEEYDEAVRGVLQGYKVRCVVTGILFAAITAGVIMSDFTDFLGGLFVGWTLINFLMSLAGFWAVRRNWKSTKAQVCSSENKYELFEDYLLFTVTRDGECVHFTKLEYDKLCRKMDTGRMYLLDFANQGYIVKKQELAENSIFHTLKPKAPKKPKKSLKGLSVVLMVLSVVSGISGVLFIGANMFNYGAMEWWYLLAFGLIPIASFVFGIYMKKYGMGKANVIAGLLAFCFILGVFYAGYTDEPDLSETYAQVEVVESYIGIDLPNPSYCDSYTDTAEGIEYKDTAMQFHSCEYLESVIVSSENWSATYSADTTELLSKVGAYRDWDYISVYNITEDEYNKVPEESGTYSMAAMFYYMDENTLYVTEYEYTK